MIMSATFVVSVPRWIRAALLIYLLAAACLCAGELPPSADNEDTAVDEDAPRKMRLDAMRRRATRIDLNLVIKDELVPAGLDPEPLMRYVDEPRKVIDGTLWCWRYRGRPVALLKTNFWNRGRMVWLDGLFSFTDEIIDAKWNEGDHRFRSRRPGLVRTSLPGAPVASDKPSVRMTQMKDSARRFSMRIHPNEGNKQEMRLLPRPVHRYDSPEDGLIDGAIFGFTCNGTNPDAALVIELERREGVADRWIYGFARMTTGGLWARLDDREVWTAIETHNNVSTFDEWLWFSAPMLTLDDAPPSRRAP